VPSIALRYGHFTTPQSQAARGALADLLTRQPKLPVSNANWQRLPGIRSK
jgi:hypothetical protein